MAEDQVERNFLESLDRLELVPERINILLGGAKTVLASNSSAILATLCDIFGHLSIYPSSSQDITVSFLEVDNDLKLPWVWDRGTYESRFVRALIDPLSRRVLVWDKRKQVWYALFKRFDINATTPEMLRSLLQIFAPADSAVVHGGAVGWESGGVLITAKGGSGKSTAVVSSVFHGARTIGDDFLLSAPRPQWKKGSVEFWSLFQTVRLSDQSPARGLLSKPLAQVSKNKQLFNLAAEYPDATLQKLAVNVLVIPNLTSELGFEPVSPEEAFMALAPSSVGLALNRHKAIRDMQALVQLLPAFRVNMTQDLQANTLTLRKLCEL